TAVSAPTSAFATRLATLSTSNRFAVLADEAAVDRALAAEQARASRPSPRGYTMPALPLFGTDVPKDQDARVVLGRALDAGYRAFDTAASYETLAALAGAARERGLASDALYVVYKVKPADDAALLAAAKGGGLRERREAEGTVRAQLTAATEALGRMPDVLMMHELSGRASVDEKTLVQLAGHVRAGRAKALGLSNVTLEDLQALHRRATELGCPIKCVENRFSPYHRDDGVRRFCEAHGIRYVSYGLLGSAQKGACVGEGHGLPSQYLLARRDPRLTALAERTGTSAAELLGAWAWARGVVPVSFSTDEKRIRENLDAKGSARVTPEVLAELDAMFAKLSPDAVRALDRSDRPEPLKALHRALPDPTMWHILDTLTADRDVAALVTETADHLASAAGPSNGDAALRNFAHALMRHVADLQSAGFDDWRPVMLPSLKEVAEARDRPEVRGRFEAWASKNAELGGGFTEAPARFPSMLGPAETAERSLDRRTWKVFEDDTFAAEVEPRVGATQVFFRLVHGEPEIVTAEVVAITDDSLDVRV
ncbi:aldo/keto reductase, partial [Myxococcota bacterium]|nr:aldo/keto reductase [Myxococcota bacterium]